MPDLGLSALTDDQLLNLLEEACNELAGRAGFVRELAQETITNSAKKMEAAKEAMEEAVEEAMSDYRRLMKQEAKEELTAGIAAGTIRLLPAVETKALVEASIEARIAAIDEEIRKLEEGSQARSYAELDSQDMVVRVVCNGEQIEKPVNAQSVKVLTEVLRLSLQRLK